MAKRKSTRGSASDDEESSDVAKPRARRGAGASKANGGKANGGKAKPAPRKPAAKTAPPPKAVAKGRRRVASVEADLVEEAPPPAPPEPSEPPPAPPPPAAPRPVAPSPFGAGLIADAPPAAPPSPAERDDDGDEEGDDAGDGETGDAVEPERGAAYIPPLPDDEDEEFEPIEEEMPEAAREAPEGATPAQILEGVRGGTLHVAAFSSVSPEALQALAESIGLPRRDGESRADLVYRLLHERPPPPPAPVETIRVEGLLEVLPDGYGFLRSPEHGYVATPSDVYVPPGLVRAVGLLPGHWVSGVARTQRPRQGYAALVEVEEVNHEDPSVLRQRVPFESLTATHPDQRFILETKPEELSMRILDLFCPLGRGQRALIVSPPRAGKTIILQKIADSLARNSPNVEIVVLLVDERPEEVTNMRRSVRGEVIASTFDQPAHRHIRLAELVVEKVKRMVELGRDVVLLLDSLTRLGRAYNNESGGTGRLLTGGMEASALTKPKRFFGSARCIEGGGSLTIVATALIETGSRLDEVIFEEFKGTGNMELVLSRELANLRLWPAIDILKSGTRKEELLLHPEEQRRVTALRRQMTGESAPEALEDVLDRMKKYRTNAEFLMNVDV
jgi:transcription termination factor Rho